MLVKVYGPAPEGQRRYSPAECIGAVKHASKAIPIPSMFRHQLRGAAKSQYQNGQPPHDAAHECLFKESREPRAHDGDLFHALQFRAHPSDLEDHARDGRRRYFEALGNV